MPVRTSGIARPKPPVLGVSVEQAETIREAVVVDSDTAASELFPQNGLLSAEVVDDPLLLLVGVPGDNES
jgi:hypothetical protein